MLVNYTCLNAIFNVSWENPLNVFTLLTSLHLYCFYMCSEESDVLVNCLYTVFGGNNKDAFAPVRFFDPLAKTLMDIIFAGRYHLSSKKFQVCASMGKTVHLP